MRRRRPARSRSILAQQFGDAVHLDLGGGGEAGLLLCIKGTGLGLTMG